MHSTTVHCNYNALVEGYMRFLASTAHSFDLKNKSITYMIHSQDELIEVATYNNYVAACGD